jgi:tetratricopeptide (TPR) repeat protein
LAKSVVVSSVQHDKWIEYHYAHCCLILGLTAECSEITERLTHSETGSDPTLGLSVNRLYAEALYEGGASRHAEQILLQALEIARGRSVHITAFSQAESVLIGIQTSLGHLDEAAAKAKELIELAIISKNKRGEAVAIVRIGIVELIKQNLLEALKSFDKAYELFSIVGDIRGQGWALLNQTEASLDLGHGPQTLEYFRRAVELYSELGISNIEYVNTLRRLKSKDTGAILLVPLENELRRLEGQKK